MAEPEFDGFISEEDAVKFDEFISEEALNDKFNGPPPLPPLSVGSTDSGRNRRNGSAPSGNSSAAKSSAKTATSKPRATSLEMGLRDFYNRIAGMVIIFDPLCGEAIANNADEMAKSLANLADKNPKVKKALQSLITQSAWGMVIAAHLPVLLAIDSHHTQIVPRLIARMIRVPVDDQQYTVDEMGNVRPV